MNIYILLFSRADIAILSHLFSFNYYSAGGHCHHIIAFLFLLNHWCQLNLKEIPADKTCTSLPQSWSVPRGDKIAPEPVMKCTFAQAKTDQLGKRIRNPTACKLYDARAKKIKNGWEQEEVLQLCSKLSKESRPPPFSYLLSDQSCSSKTDTVIGRVPVGCYLGYQLFDGKTSDTIFTIDRPAENMINIDPHNSSVKAFPQLPVQSSIPHNYIKPINLQSSHSNILDEVIIDLRDCWELEQTTVQQSMEPRWMIQRCKRLTASNFAKVLNRKRQPSEQFLRDIFCPKDLSKVPSIRHGRQQEIAARSMYCRKMQKQCKTFSVYDCGLVVNPLHPYLGASPDGKVYDPTEKEPFGLLEIKNPFKYRNLTISEACQDPTFYLGLNDSKPSLKQDHMMGYYAQVQGQLAVTGLTWCDFVVHLAGTHQIHVQRIYYNKTFWDNISPRLTTFYFEHGLPFLAYLRESNDHTA